MRREGRTAEVVVEVAVGVMQAAAAGQQFALAVGGGTRLAQGGTALGAGVAVSARGHEHHDDVVADGEIVDAFAQRLDDARGLVAECHRKRPGPVAVDDAEVRMAQARGLDGHPHLTGAGGVQCHGLDREGTAVRVRAGGTRGAENGGCGLHGPTLGA